VSCDLTSAEERVVVLAAFGRSNQAIAMQLFLSVRTVECHLSHAYAKLGVHSKAELAAWWALNVAGALD
jgi:DNA-binding CsgD family transcriptional regulator